MISFYGDSYTFGQYLDFYDYGMTECSTNGFKTIKCNNKIHHNENHEYPLKEHWLYYDNIIYGEWYRRFNSIVKRRFSTQVGKKLNIKVISPIQNGGDNKLIYENCRMDNKSDLKIIMLTHLSRDMKEWLNITELNSVKEKSLSELYYKKLFKKFSKLDNIRFIGSWAKEEYKHGNQYYLDRIIPLKVNNIEYHSIYHLRKNENSQYTIGEDFPIHDSHPNQKLHNIIAESIIQYMN